MKRVLQLLMLLLVQETHFTHGDVLSEEFYVPAFSATTPLDELWQQILFPENETIQNVVLVDPYGPVVDLPDDSVCIYFTGHHDFEKNNDTRNYHCARAHSQPCLNGGVCENTECKRPGGVCTCPDGFEGVNCGVQTDQVDQPDCPLPCVHGVCVADDKFPYCYCLPGYTGALCDQDAYHYQCTANGFHVCITPFSLTTFGGEIYVKGRRHESECTLKPVTYPPDPHDGIPDWCTGYVASIPFNSSCGLLGPTIDGDMTSFQLHLLLQYGQGVVTCTDEKVILTCQFDKGSLLLYKTLELQIEGLNVLPTVTKTEDFAPVSLVLSGADGALLTSSLPVGYKVDVCIYTLEALGYEGVVINSVLANNTRGGDDYREMFLYRQGCVSENANSILSVAPHWTSEDRLEVCLQFKVFFFNHDLTLTNPVLGLVFDVSLVSDRADAVQPECEGRRKRQAVAGKETTVSTTIDVIIPPPDQEEETSSKVPDTERQWLMPMLYSTGGVAATIVVVLVVVGVLLCRRSNKKKAPLDVPRIIPTKFY